MSQRSTIDWEDTKHNHWSVGGTRWCQAIFLKITPSQPGTPRPSIYKWLGYQLDDEPNLYIRKWLFHHFHPCINGRLGFQEEVPSIKNAHLLFHPFFCLNCGGFYYGLFCCIAMVSLPCYQWSLWKCPNFKYPWWVLCCWSSTDPSFSPQRLT